MTRRFPLAGEFPDPVSLVPTRRGLWISERSSGTILPMKLDGRFGRPLRTKSLPDLITLGSDDNLWYAASNDSKIGRIDIGW